MTASHEELLGALKGVASRLTLDLTEPQASALLNYLNLLERWNATYNLTSVRTPAAMLTQHLADCLAVQGPLQRELLDRSGVRLLDVGSGGGLPGVVIAVLHPEYEITCVDAVGKKAAFIQQVAVELRLANLRARHSRVEALAGASFDVITARAFSSLPDLVRLTRKHLRRDGVWLAMKGKTPTDEIEALPADIEVFHVEPLQVPGLDARRCIVWMRTIPPPAGTPVPRSL